MKEIQLTQNQVALIDDEDMDRISAIKWCAIRSHGSFYASGKIGRVNVQMHRIP